MLMQIDGTFIFVVISFLIFLFIIKAILYTPFSKIIDERQNFYDKNSKLKTDSKEKTRILIEQKESLLNQSKLEAADIVKEAVQSAKQKSSQKIKQIKKDIQIKTDEHKKELLNESIIAKQEIKSQINTIVNSIISKVLNENVAVNLDENKINGYLYEDNVKI